MSRSPKQAWLRRQRVTWHSSVLLTRKYAKCSTSYSSGSKLHSISRLVVKLSPRYALPMWTALAGGEVGSWRRGVGSVKQNVYERGGSERFEFTSWLIGAFKFCSTINSSEGRGEGWCR